MPDDTTTGNQGPRNVFRREKPLIFEVSPSNREPEGEAREVPEKEEAAAPGEARVMSRKPAPNVRKLEPKPRRTVIKVVGVGGGGCNAVNSMISKGFDHIEFHAINTDAQALHDCKCENKLHIGGHLTDGNGAGSLPEIGEQAAREAEDEIREILEGASMIFITAGLGGGTGTGAAPVVAEIARSMDILNVAIVTKPFHFEGSQRMRRASEGIRALSQYVDTMIVILNDKLSDVVGPKTALTDAFDVANTVLAQGIRAISELITTPGLINVDFRDVKTIMGQTGGAVMGVGEGKGDNRAVEAVRKACHSPLQEKIQIDGARGVLINITGPRNMTMHEIHEATVAVYEAADPEAHVTFGVVIDEAMGDSMRVTIIATGFGQSESDGYDSARRARSRPATEAAQARPVAPPRAAAAPTAAFEPVAGTPPAAPPRAMPTEPVAAQPVMPQAPPPAAPRRERVVIGSQTSQFTDFSKRPVPKPAQPQADPDTGQVVNGGLHAPSQATAFADPEREAEEDSKSGFDDPFEVPALHRRRRHRFFE